MEYLILVIAFVLIVVVILFLASALTPNNWGNLRGGIGNRYIKAIVTAIIFIFLIFVILMLLQRYILA